MQFFSTPQKTRKLFLFILLLITFNTFSQQINVKGTAFDTTKGRNCVTIILNDTINKLFAGKTNKWDDDNRLWDDTNYVVRAFVNGQFNIKAKKSDSLFFQSYRHITKSFLVADLLKMNEINILLEPQACEPYVERKCKMPKYFAIIGEKIKVNLAKEKYYCDGMTTDSKFNAQYKVVKDIYGNYPSDTIHFVAYDHYGYPAFGNYQHILLFIRNYCGENVLKKYQFFNVYKTVNNKWASPYQAYHYSMLEPLSRIKPVKIKFKVPIEFDISTASREWIEKSYPSPYYKIKNGKAVAIYGNYVPELIELKKLTELKSIKTD